MTSSGADDGATRGMIPAMTLSVQARWAILVLYAVVALAIIFMVPFAENNTGYLFSSIMSVGLGLGGVGLWYILIWSRRPDAEQPPDDAN